MTYIGCQRCCYGKGGPSYAKQSYFYPLAEDGVVLVPVSLHQEGSTGPQQCHQAKLEHVRKCQANLVEHLRRQAELQEHGIAAVDILESSDYFKVLIDVPGKTEGDIVVYVSDGYLFAEACAAASDEKSPQRYHKHERESGRFRRVFRLTKKSNPDAIYHSVRDGVLTIVVPKAVPQEDQQKGKDPVKVSVDETDKSPEPVLQLRTDAPAPSSSKGQDAEKKASGNQQTEQTGYQGMGADDFEIVDEPLEL